MALYLCSNPLRCATVCYPSTKQSKYSNCTVNFLNILRRIRRYRIMQIVHSGKVSQLHDLVIRGKLSRLYSNSKHLIIRQKKIAGKPSRLEANPWKPRKFSTANDLHYTGCIHHHHQTHLIHYFGKDQMPLLTHVIQCRI